MADYCTLFNTNYLSRGIALYESLVEHADNFRLFVYAFDDECADLLTGLRYEKMTVVRLADFEDDRLLAVKESRTVAEYCWTCTSSVILHAIRKFGLAQCTYIDADMQFYADPAVLLEEMGDASILLSPHNYAPRYESAIQNGIYCVQFMSFKADQRGLAALEWWRNACIDWCYARHEDGKFGDQKYLDDWTERFEGVHVCMNPGGGVAPWNVERYRLLQSDDGSGQLLITDRQTGSRYPLVFFHFHGLKWVTVRFADCGLHRLSRQVKQVLYKPYIRRNSEIARKLSEKLLPLRSMGACRNPPDHFLLRRLKRFLLGNYNVIRTGLRG